MKNHLQAYRFSEQEMNKMIELKKIFEENAFEINRFPEVYIDEEFTFDELDIPNLNIDKFGCYRFKINNDNSTSEGIIILYTKAIEMYCNLKKLNLDYVKLIVLMHELGHWLTHWSNNNNNNWNENYCSSHKNTHESLAEIIVFWGIEGNNELEKIQKILTPLDKENPYYLYNNLKEFSQKNILRKLIVIRSKCEKNDVDMYNILLLKQEEFDKEYGGFFVGRRFGL